MADLQLQQYTQDDDQDFVMDDLFVEQIKQLDDFQSIISEFESILSIKDNDYSSQLIFEENEYNLWEMILDSDINHYEAEIESYNMALSDLTLESENLECLKLLQLQKTFVFNNECNKLRNEYDILQKQISKQSLNAHIEYNVLIGISRKYGKQIIFNDNIFSKILSFIEIDNIFKLERVSISWYDAIHSWKGWIISNNNQQIYKNNLFILNKYQNLNNNNHQTLALNDATSVTSSSNYSSTSDNDKLYYPRFRRFALSIETQKNNMYQVEIVGYSDKTKNAISGISHDKSKKKVTIQPIEGIKQFEKEFSICDVILGNHQRLARIKEKCERLKSRCSSDKNTQKGYQITTLRIQTDINILDKDVKELELQQKSDLNTINFLKQQINIKTSTLNELKNIPIRLKDEENKNELIFQKQINDLSLDKNTDDLLLKTKKEKETLTKAIKLEQSNLRSITQQRDELKKEYDKLKNKITQLSATNDLL